MITSIIKKEWLKIRFIILTLFLISTGIITKFWYNLDFSFSTVEPESMMWHRFVSLEQKPYEYLSYLYFIFGLAIAAFQFIPERVRNRIKIMTHLPISLQKSLFLHLLIGIFYIFALSLIVTAGIVSIISSYYPAEIVSICIKDISFYFLGSIIVYLGLSSALIEKNPIVSAIKLFITLLFIFVFHKTTFTLVDISWIVITFVLLFVVLDSFYSIKEQRLDSIVFKAASVLTLVVVGFFSYGLYIDKYKHEFNKYYLFYSPIVKDFVYQKNFGDHQFEYGIKGKETFDRKKYESLLPFVYWRDLDIQGKLPLHIGNEVFDKPTIKNSRLSFSYNPTYLKREELKMYPLINPHSNTGMIKFPEEMIALQSDGINIYDYDNGLNKPMTQELKNLLTSQNVSFPIKDIWGKATNMKPFDLGYFFLDAKDKLYRLNRYNDSLNLEEIAYPANIKIEFMKISENKKRELGGYMIDSKNSFYIIDYQTLMFKKITLKNFDYKRMKLLFISNPKYYLVRYSDEDTYYGAVFDKKLNKLDEEVFN